MKKILMWFFILAMAIPSICWAEEITNNDQFVDFDDKLLISTAFTFGPGTLSWENGELTFEGDLHESAIVFFEFLKPYVDEYIKEECQKSKSVGGEKMAVSKELKEMTNYMTEAEVDEIARRGMTKSIHTLILLSRIANALETLKH